MPLKFAASTTAGQLLASMLVNLIPDAFGATAPGPVASGAPATDAPVAGAAAADIPAAGTSAGAGGRGRLPPAGPRPAAFARNAAGAGRKARPRSSGTSHTLRGPRAPAQTRPPPPP